MYTEKTLTTPEQIPDKQEAPSVDKIRQSIEAQAISAESTSQVVEQSQDKPAQSTLGIQQELKAQAYRRSLTNIRQHLSGPDKVLSTVIHKPIVEHTSNAFAASIGRPLGLLGGASVALIGSCWVLYASKHYGFRYNYALLLGFFIGGYMLGITVEVLIRLARKKS